MTNCSCLVLVKNEQYWLPYVLKQTEGIFSNYVIYDVGSTDNTRDIIHWFMDRNKGKAEIFYRELPDCPPVVQGTFRNSMIAEGKAPVYFLLDGDELYTKDSLTSLRHKAHQLYETNRINDRIRYGVVTRVEVSSCLRQQYCERRGHHRLYTRDAFWTGTHPGEAPYHAQNDKSESQFRDVVCWHMHNTLRSPKEEEAHRRTLRKMNKTYHPGTEMVGLDLLKELPELRQPIKNFDVTPSLKVLQEAWANGKCSV